MWHSLSDGNISGGVQANAKYPMEISVYTMESEKNTSDAGENELRECFGNRKQVDFFRMGLPLSKNLFSSLGSVSDPYFLTAYAQLGNPFGQV